MIRTPTDAAMLALYGLICLVIGLMAPYWAQRADVTAWLARMRSRVVAWCRFHRSWFMERRP